jgi:hypothetical protein
MYVYKGCVGVSTGGSGRVAVVPFDVLDRYGSNDTIIKVTASVLGEIRSMIAK